MRDSLDKSWKANTFNDYKSGGYKSATANKYIKIKRLAIMVCDENTAWASNIPVRKPTDHSIGWIAKMPVSKKF